MPEQLSTQSMQMSFHASENTPDPELHTVLPLQVAGCLTEVGKGVESTGAGV